MIKKIIKDLLANTAQKLVRFCVNKGCMTQDDVIEKLSEYVDVPTKHGVIKFFCPGQIPIWRANTFFDLEPETLAWVDSFETDTVFFDIGANVGLYSLYAGMKGHEVLSFEPYSANQYILNKNIYINKLDHRITALSAAISDKFQFSKFYMQNMQFGSAENTTGKAVDWKEEKFIPKFQQGIMEYSLDQLLNIQKMPFPNYIKIDVDGVEDQILLGARETLKDIRVKQVLIELDEKHSMHDWCVKFMGESGFVLDVKEQSDVFAQGTYKNMYNYIFSRK